MPLSDVAFAAGFSSIRQFNETLQTACGSIADIVAPRCPSPRQPFREPARRPDRVPSAGGARAVRLRGGLRPPRCQRRAGMRGGPRRAYRRTLRLPPDPGSSVSVRAATMLCTLALQDLRDLSAAIGRCRRLLDLDADPEVVIEALAPMRPLRPVVAEAPGQRIPGTVDPTSWRCGRCWASRCPRRLPARTPAGFVEAYGTEITDPAGGLTHLFPDRRTAGGYRSGPLAVRCRRGEPVTGHGGCSGRRGVCLDAGADWQQARQQLDGLAGKSGGGRRRSSPCGDSAIPTPSRFAIWAW